MIASYILTYGEDENEVKRIEAAEEYGQENGPRGMAGRETEQQGQVVSSSYVFRDAWLPN